ncbi:MAG: ion transporter [Ruminococcaceae bacterium]|nr:ion transporter [Oscillospiraceae bacterium]
MRRKIFDIVEKSTGGNVPSAIYDIFMMIIIVLSLLPLTSKTTNKFFVIVEIITTAVFIIDYIIRWSTADLKLAKGKRSFLLYPFSAMAIIDIVSILPSIFMLNSAFKALKAFRLIRAMRVFRFLKSFRYSKNIEIIASVFKKQKRSLVAVGGLAVGYILISAMIVFNVEQDTFETFFDAVYWATVSLTTVGYGDIYAISPIGKAITMISALLGVAIVALPAGIVTAGYMKEIEKENEEI